MKNQTIKPKSIRTALGLVLLLISAVSILAVWSLTSKQLVESWPHLIRIIAIANSFSLVLLGWIYDQVRRLCVNEQQQEQALRQSELRFRLAVDCFPDTFVIYDAERQLQFVNRHGIEISGYPEPALLGHRDDELFPEEITQAYLPLLEQAIETRKVQKGECTLTLPSGTFTIVVDYVPLLDERGEINQILGITHDITVRKQAEEVLHRMNEKLESTIGERLSQLQQVYEDLLAEITKRKQIEEALRRSEERFRIALQNSPTIVFNQDSELRYTWFYNSNSESDTEGMIGKLDSDLMLAEDAQQLSAIKRQVLTTGVGTRQEILLTFKNGEVCYYDLTVEPLCNLAGEVVGITCAATNITDIRVREQQLRAIFEESLDALLIADDQGTYLQANPAASQLFGLPTSELLGKRVADFMEPGFDFEGAWRLFRQQGYLRGEVRLMRSDGTWTEVEFAAKANFLPGRHLSVLRDISKRKQIELAFIEECNFNSAILETANALIAVLDKQGKFIRFNQACEQLTGYSVEEVKGKYIWDLFLIPEEIEPVQAIIQKLQSGQFPNEHENYWVVKDGSRRLISWFNTVTLDVDDSVKYMIGIGIDITDRNLVQEMHRALEREQALSQLRFRFFSMASHEFRTPLSTILLTAQIMESSNYKWSDEKWKRSLHRIVSAAQEMRQMLDDILTINRAETGRLEFAPTSIDIQVFCHQLLAEVRSYASQLHTLNFSVQGEFEQILLDKKLLRYTLIPLLANAIKYSPKGGEVKLELNATQKEIFFHIHDEGIGILLSDQPNLFDAFYRGENVDFIPGSGLGLTVAKKCVELHGGTISFTSKVGVGTTFTVRIPISDGNFSGEGWILE